MDWSAWGVSWGDSWAAAWGPLHQVDDPPRPPAPRGRRSGDGFRRPIAPVLKPIEEEETLLLCLL